MKKSQAGQRSPIHYCRYWNFPSWWWSCWWFGWQSTKGRTCQSFLLRKWWLLLAAGHRRKSATHRSRAPKKLSGHERSYPYDLKIVKFSQLSPVKGINLCAQSDYTYILYQIKPTHSINGEVLIPLITVFCRKYCTILTKSNIILSHSISIR